MNVQMIFDVVLYGVRAQGGPSTAGRKCRYRGANGRRCPVGMWISDDTYNPTFEGLKVATIVETCPDYVPSWFAEHKDLLTDLQYAHDTAAGYPDFFRIWEDRMAKVASNYGLRYTIAEPDGAAQVYKEHCNAQRTTLPASPRRNDAIVDALPEEVQPLLHSALDAGDEQCAPACGSSVCEGVGSSEVGLYEANTA